MTTQSPRSKPSSIRRPLGVARTICISYENRLAPGQTLSGTPEVRSVPTTGLGLGAPVRNSTEFLDVDTNKTCPANMGILVRCTPTKEDTYQLHSKCNLSDAGESDGDPITVVVDGGY